MQRKAKAVKEAVGQAEIMLKRHEELMAGYQKNCELLMRKRIEVQRALFEKNVEDNFKFEENHAKKELSTGEKKWSAAFSLAKGRLGEDCSICLGELGNGRPLMVTSCGHLFHAACIMGFEQFASEKKGCCPNCRHTYQKTPFMKTAE